VIERDDLALQPVPQRLLGHIADNSVAVTAELERLQLLPVAVDQHQAADPARVKPSRTGGADAGCRSGNEGGLAGKLAHGPVLRANDSFA
jgi:hypothetical protein